VEKDYYTLMIFPGTAAEPRRARVSKHLFKFALSFILIVSVGLVGTSVYFSKKYQTLTSEKKQLVELRRQAKLQKIQVEKFSKQVRSIEDEVARLERFEKKLRMITALEDSVNTEDKSWGVGGSYGLDGSSFSTSLEQDAKNLAEKISFSLETLTNQTKVQAVSFQELDEFFKSQTSLLSSTPSVWPLRGWVTSGFGFRKSPFTGLRERHEGIDIASRLGSPVRSTADGVVVVSGRVYGYGKVVEVDHGYGLVTRYGHNSKHLVKVGDRVKRGQIVAEVGNTGRSTGPHLHYEVLLHGVPVNPNKYIFEE
jgi:murein DD-endopeptidase MepM/ murein hydrolase activator NlpD